MPRPLRAVVAALALAPVAVAQPKQAAPAVPATYPTLTNPVSLGATRGTTADLTFTGTNLADVTGIWTNAPGTLAVAPGQKDATKLLVKWTVPADATVGLYAVRVATKTGVSNLKPLCVDAFPQVADADKNQARATPQAVPNPCVVTGVAAVEAADYFRFPVKKGVPVTVEVLARRLGSPLDPVVILSDGTGRELGGVYADDTPGLQTDARVTYTPKADGEVIAEVRDSTYKGGADFAYRVRIGNFAGATTAFPLAVRRGQSASASFTGPGLESVKPAAVKMPATGWGVSVSPGGTGWPVPVLASDVTETVEQEPNDTPTSATPLPVPGGVTARFGPKSDKDHFKFPAKKGQKLLVQAKTFEVNAPTEVYLRVLDPKGAEVGQSNPMQPGAKVEFTASADGEYVAACEHLNYLGGPSEVYHLSVSPVSPDFAVTAGLDRLDVPAGASVGLLPITGITKLNGFAGAIELSVNGPGLSGKLSVPATAAPTPAAPLYLPVTAAAGTKPGPVVATVTATAVVDGTTLTRTVSTLDLVKAAFAGLPNPPAEYLNQIAVAVVPPPPYRLTLVLDKPAIAKGATVKAKVKADRDKGYDAEIPLAVVQAPANVTAKLKPIPKGAAEVEVELTAAANAAAGPLLLQGATKEGRFLLPAVPLTITEPAKKDEKKDAPKKK